MEHIFNNMSEINSWTELSDNKELLKTQYDLVKGTWPKEYNEVVLIIKEDGTIDDYTLYTLGLKNQQELKEKYDYCKSLGIQIDFINDSPFLAELGGNKKFFNVLLDDRAGLESAYNNLKYVLDNI